MYNNYIGLLPKVMLADKNLILKHAKDFYRARGTEKSIKFLMRALHNTEVEFYYPKADILRASDGKWYIEKALRVGDAAVNNVANGMVFSQFAKKQIYGMTSGATAIVEDVNVYYNKGALVTELRISNSIKPFLSDEQVFTYFEEEGRTKFASARIFGGQIVSTEIQAGGTGYVEGTVIPITPTSPGGLGGKIVIYRVSRGGINRIFITGSLPDNGGAGYRVDDLILIAGGGGTGALGGVESVWENVYHPNEYKICSMKISDVANVSCDMFGVAPAISNTGLIIDSSTTVANSVVANSVNYWTYANCGPAKFCYVITQGQDYVGTPKFTIQANSIVTGLGILGKLKVQNGGRNYQVNDKIEFYNREISNTYGCGAAARVSSVNATGAILNVAWVQVSGHYIGGEGYDPENLPYTNVVSTTGVGANVSVETTLGRGGSFTFTTESIGIIREVKILDEGTGYVTPPILNLTGYGDGQAKIKVSIVTGIYAYPGRYLNDDGMVSAHNYLQDRDYYQNFSYVIRSDKSLNKYRKTLNDLTHPAGAKLFGQCELTDTELATMNNSQVYSSTSYPDYLKSNLVFFMSSSNTNNTIAGKIGNLVNANSVGDMINGAYINNGILYFDGTNDYVVFPQDNTLDVNSLTIELWASVPTTFQDAVLFQKGANQQQYSLNFNLQGDLVFNANAAGTMKTFTLNAENYITSDRWTHIVVTHTSGSQKMYINGVNVANSKITGIITANNNGVSIGAYGGYLSRFRSYNLIGKMASVRVYNKVLSDNEVIKNYNIDKGRFGI